jgi:hypothetical protein
LAMHHLAENWENSTVIQSYIGKFQASCRLSVKILSSNLLLVSNLLGRFVLGFSLIRI